MSELLKDKNLLEQRERLRIKFDQLIAPDIVLNFLPEQKTALITGSVKIAIEQMIQCFTSGLNLNPLLGILVKKSVDDEGYHLDIRGIAKADLVLENNAIKVKAVYRNGQEWWAKPIALIAMQKILGDFANQVVKQGVKPGFQNLVTKTITSLKANNEASLALSELFEEQTFHLDQEKAYLLTDFQFTDVITRKEGHSFVIDFNAQSSIRCQR